MASNMGFQPMTDAELQFLSDHSYLFFSFLNAQPLLQAPPVWKAFFLGAKPQPIDPPIPWPASERPSYMTEITHRSVHVFHYLLNGTYERVSGAGSLFESWLTSDWSEGVRIPDGDAFGFWSADIPELARLLDGLSEEVITRRWNEFAAENDIDQESSFYDVEFFSRNLSDVRRFCQLSIDQSKGLMWLVC